jgi:ABC-2 type transport system ATP-binding protein
MDEVEALAHRAAVLSRGRIVASGEPASIGGRDRGAATIRFTLPTGTAASDLPVVPSRLEGASVEIRTSDELHVLGALVNWALNGNVELAGLTVARVTLEDVYLELTQGADATSADAS